MIGYVSGEVLRKQASDLLILTASGVGYVVFTTENIIKSLAVGSAVSFFIETSIGEDFIKLYGFQTEADKDLFNILTSVQGVGAKAGLAILNLGEAAQIKEAIFLQNAKFFTQATGVGGKLAERLVNELKNKKDLFKTDSPSFANSLHKNEKETSILQDVRSALINLGYDDMSVSSVLGKMTNIENHSQDELLKSALKALSLR